ncbi:MAG: hypothetical protein M0026_00250 [Nocardiopsaceae bacterium]|nr:hypothetical protein [Nocardiopsaceae bacterium]
MSTLVGPVGTAFPLAGERVHRVNVSAEGGTCAGEARRRLRCDFARTMVTLAACAVAVGTLVAYYGW